jgi:hypothetical protein
MAIMDFLPQFKDNTQDVSGVPANDTMAQLELQRKLKMAQALQEGKVPEGQMISGHYVAPSWTQSLANAYGKYRGSKAEQEAIKQYGEYTKTKEQKQADALRGFVEGMQPRATTTMQDNFVTKPLEQGMNVPTSPFGTVDEVAQIAPKFGMDSSAPQNMQGEMTMNQPTPATTYTPKTQQELISNFYNYAQKSGNPDMASKFAMEQFGQAIKPKVTKFIDVGDKQIEVDENNTPTGRELPKGLSPNEAYQRDFERFKFENPSASDLLRNKTTLRGQDLVNARDKEKNDPYHIFGSTSPANMSKQTKQIKLDNGSTVNGTLDVNSGKYYVIQDGKKFWVEE